MRAMPPHSLPECIRRFRGFRDARPILMRMQRPALSQRNLHAALRFIAQHAVARAFAQQQAGVQRTPAHS
jgi:hypothetical protein